MGVASSTQVSADIKSIQQWKWTQVVSTIKAYNEQELPFAITAANIVTISGMTESEATCLVNVLSKQPNTGVVNALTVFSALICLGDELAGSLDSRIEALYDLVDFDGTAQVNIDEVVILFLCCGAALVGILKGQREAEGEDQVFPSDTICRRLAGQLYQDLDLLPSDLLGKSEFISWAISILSDIEEINVDSVFKTLY